MFTYNIFLKRENPLCVMAQRSAGFLYLASVKVGIISYLFPAVKYFPCAIIALTMRNYTSFLPFYSFLAHSSINRLYIYIILFSFPVPFPATLPLIRKSCILNSESHRVPFLFRISPFSSESGWLLLFSIPLHAFPLNNHLRRGIILFRIKASSREGFFCRFSVSFLPRSCI